MENELKLKTKDRRMLESGFSIKKLPLDHKERKKKWIQGINKRLGGVEDIGDRIGDYLSIIMLSERRLAKKEERALENQEGE